MTRKVLIVQRRLTHYRVAFFEMLKAELLEYDIELQLLIGEGTPEEISKQDSGVIPWAIKMPTSYLLHNKLCWQPVYKYLSGADLVIVTQENAQIVNHLIILFPRKVLVAYWGHGANLQCLNPNNFKEKFKRFMTSKVDWWFAYTKLSAEIVLKSGFPSSRLSVVDNSVDVESVTRDTNLTSETQTIQKESLGIESNSPIGVFLGSLYKGKKIDFLLSSAVKIRDKQPKFGLIIIGDGPESSKIKSFCKKNPWARWVGAQHGKQKALLLSLADIMLCPAGVGLGILDSFASQTPLVTTDISGHGPEISYLDNWKNGVMTPYNSEDYVAAVLKLLDDSELLASLKSGCTESSNEYSIEKMTRRFTNGILGALGLTKRAAEWG